MGDRKPILCLDFDGVLHSYTSGWQGASVIPDPPVPGAMEFLAEAVEHFDVQVYSSRSNQSGGISAMQRWMAEHLPEHHMHIGWPYAKPPAMVGIDDRVITFEGTWPSMETLKAFQPWNKRDV